MLTYMLDTNICIYVMKNYPLDLREKLNALAEQLCMSRPKPRCRSWGSGNSRPRPAGQRKVIWPGLAIFLVVHLAATTCATHSTRGRGERS